MLTSSSVSEFSESAFGLGRDNSISAMNGDHYPLATTEPTHWTAVMRRIASSIGVILTASSVACCPRS